MVTYERFFSKNALGMKQSEIRELLKFIRRPEIISFAGGLPAPDLFPVEEVMTVTEAVLEREGRIALQYGQTEGDQRLKEELVKFMRTDGFDVTTDNILVVSGSQQGLDLISKIFLNRRDIVLVGEPTYVGGIQAFNSYGAHMIPVSSDNEGMDSAVLDETIVDLIKGGLEDKIKFIYTVPDFQNPSGKTMSVGRRKKILEIADLHDLILIEDSPYRKLRYSGTSVEPMYTLDQHRRVISIFTFSKILIPGFRLGWAIAQKEVIEKLVIAKQAVDLCTSPFTQALTYEYLHRGYLDKQIGKIISSYKEKRDFMLKMMDEHMPDIAGLAWTKPEGGLFIWVTLPEYMDSKELFMKAIDKKVAYVIGEAFHPQAKCRNEFRLNFSYSSINRIEEGVKRLSAAIMEYEQEIKEEKLGVQTVSP